MDELPQRIATARAIGTPAAASSTARAPHRARTTAPRIRQLNLRLTAAQFADISSAAAEVRLTASGYAAEAAVSAAEGQAPPLGHALRLALTHLLLARNEVRRASTAILDALAAAPDAQRPWVDDAGETATRAIRRVDDAAAAVVDGLSRVLR